MGKVPSESTQKPKILDVVDSGVDGGRSKLNDVPIDDELTKTLIIRYIGQNSSDGESDVAIPELVDLHGLNLGDIQRKLKSLEKDSIIKIDNSPIVTLRFIHLTDVGRRMYLDNLPEIKHSIKYTAHIPSENQGKSDAKKRIKLTTRTNWCYLYTNDDFTRLPESLLQDKMLYDVDKVVFTRHIAKENVINEMSVIADVDESLHPSDLDEAKQWLKYYQKHCTS